MRPVRIEEPCSLSWDEMAGDDTKRFCETCQHHVLNVSEMTEAELASLAERTDQVCIRAEVDPVRGLRTKQRWIASAIAFGVTGSIFGCSPAGGNIPKDRTSIGRWGSASSIQSVQMSPTDNHWEPPVTTITEYPVPQDGAGCGQSDPLPAQYGLNPEPKPRDETPTPKPRQTS